MFNLSDSIQSLFKQIKVSYKKKEFKNINKL